MIFLKNVDSIVFFLYTEHSHARSESDKICAYQRAFDLLIIQNFNNH